MSMRISKTEFVGDDSSLGKTKEVIAHKMALDIETEIFARMKELGLKQKDLARLLGISPAAVSKMLSGKGNLTVSSIAKFAEVLGCDVGPITFRPIKSTEPKSTEPKNSESKSAEPFCSQGPLQIESTDSFFKCEAESAKTLVS